MDIPKLINTEQEMTTFVGSNNIMNNLTDQEEHFTHINDDTIKDWEVKDFIL